MRFLLLGFVIGSFFASAAPVPVGFEDEAVLQSVMSGEFMEEPLLNTSTELHTVFRAFFPQTSSDSFMALTIDHPRYPEIYSTFKEGRTTQISADQTQFDWWSHMVIHVGLFSKHLYPTGRHTLSRPADAISEGKS